MNKKLNAVALANQHLRRENEELWKRNETVERGAEEMEAMYRAMIMQIVMRYGHATNEGGAPYQYVTLPKAGLMELVKKYTLEASTTDDEMTLRIVERKEDEDGETD